MLKFRNIFGKNKCQVIGMIHVDALPGTPKYEGNFQQSIQRAKHEASLYRKHKVDAILLENMHDLPYIQQKHFGPEVVAAMTRIATEIKSLLPVQIPCGIQILACGNHEALAVAKAANLQFIRAEGFVFSHIADEGFTDSMAGTMLRYRKQIDAENVAIFTDLKKKHCSHAITQDLSLRETAQAAEFFLTDGIILTGNSTGRPVNIDDLKEIYGHVKVPLLLGSGITTENIGQYFHRIDGAIVGSYFKKNGHWANELCEQRIEKFMEKILNLRER